jgi:hypothetical protein
MKKSKPQNISLKLHPRTKKGTYRAKNQKETKDKYNKQTKKAFINLTLPRDLKESIPDYPYIYKWYRNDTNKIFYVGAGINKRAWTLSRRNSLTINIIKKIGKKGVIIKLFKMKNWGKTLKEEIRLIRKHGRRDNKTGILSNMTDGGEGAVGRKMSDKQKKIISKRNKNKTYTSAERKNLSEKMIIARANMSQETLDRTSEKLRQRFIGKPRPKWMKSLLLENLARGRSKVLKWNKSKDGKKHLKEIRELTKIWHKSKEGLTWHSTMSKETWKYKKTTKKICINCNKKYETYFPTRSKYCSPHCKSLYRNKS